MKPKPTPPVGAKAKAKSANGIGNGVAPMEMEEKSDAEVDMESDQSDGDDEDEEGDDGEPVVVTKIKMMVSGACQILKATPLYNIKNDGPSLKKYGKTIDKALLRHADSLTSNETKVFSTTVSIRPLPHENQKKGADEFMFIEIFEQKGRDKKTRKQCFMTMFFGYGSSKVAVKHLKRTKNVKNLPSCMYNGSGKFWKILQPALEALFSCNFLLAEISPVKLKSLSAVWIMESIRTKLYDRNVTSDKIRLDTIQSLRSKDFGASLETMLHFRPLAQKWERYIDTSKELSDIIKAIWNDIANEIVSRDKIDFRKSVLTRFSTPSFTISSCGRFKLRLEDTDMIMTILKQITESLETLCC